MPWILANADDYESFKGKVVDDSGFLGECVSFVKQAVKKAMPARPLPATSARHGVSVVWAPGQKLRREPDPHCAEEPIAAGTVIATFIGARYTGLPEGHKHAAIYLSHDDKGIRVWDQWKSGGDPRIGHAGGPHTRSLVRAKPVLVGGKPVEVDKGKLAALVAWLAAAEAVEARAKQIKNARAEVAKLGRALGRVRGDAPAAKAERKALEEKKDAQAAELAELESSKEKLDQDRAAKLALVQQGLTVRNGLIGDGSDVGLVEALTATSAASWELGDEQETADVSPGTAIATERVKLPYPADREANSWVYQAQAAIVAGDGAIVLQHAQPVAMRVLPWITMRENGRHWCVVHAAGAPVVGDPAEIAKWEDERDEEPSRLDCVRSALEADESWTSGPRVVDLLLDEHAALQPGTVIATFDDDGAIGGVRVVSAIEPGPRLRVLAPAVSSALAPKKDPKAKRKKVYRAKFTAGTLAGSSAVGDIGTANSYFVVETTEAEHSVCVAPARPATANAPGGQP